MIIENYFLLIGSLMALFFAIGHAMWGQRYVLGDVHASAMPPATKHMLTVIWNQPTVFHGCAAVALFIASTSRIDALRDSLALFIGVVSFGFFLNYVLISLIRDRAALPKIIPQVLTLLIYWGILAAGIYFG